jgi:hypothetical protein
MIAMAGVVVADDTATRVAVIEKDVKLLREDVGEIKTNMVTRVAVIEKDVKLLREDVGEIKTNMVTKSEFETLCETVRDIKTIKQHGMLTWQDSHIRLHDNVENSRNSSNVFWFGALALIFTAVSFGKDFIMGKRNGNRG